jgi:peptide-methionine (R)-S-oxide reductase
MDMSSIRTVLLVFCALFPLAACAQGGGSPSGTKADGNPTHFDLAKYPAANEKVTKPEKEWKAELPEASFDVLRHAGTERPFTGALLKEHGNGVFVCAACGNPLFSSHTKFESGTGWPSFWAPIEANRVIEKTDNDFGMSRTEILCARCGGHLGHVFDDGPKPTGLRYCMNSVALKFEGR